MHQSHIGLYILHHLFRRCGDSLQSMCSLAHVPSKFILAHSSESCLHALCLCWIVIDESATLSHLLEQHCRNSWIGTDNDSSKAQKWVRHKLTVCALVLIVDLTACACGHSPADLLGIADGTLSSLSNPASGCILLSAMPITVQQVVNTPKMLLVLAYRS